MKQLYIDDLRHPKTNKNWIVLRNYENTIQWLKSHGCPHYISFDHDLGMKGSLEAKSGYDIAKWIVNQDIELNGEFIPKEFEFNVHSANPVGAKNISSLLNNYLKQKYNKI